MKRMKVNKSALVAHIVLICFVLFCTLPTLLLRNEILSAPGEYRIYFRLLFGPKGITISEHTIIIRQRRRYQQQRRKSTEKHETN